LESRIKATDKEKKRPAPKARKNRDLDMVRTSRLFELRGNCHNNIIGKKESLSALGVVQVAGRFVWLSPVNVIGVQTPDPLR
jgi:hypothetical protein